MSPSLWGSLRVHLIRSLAPPGRQVKGATACRLEPFPIMPWRFFYRPLLISFCSQDPACRRTLRKLFQSLFTPLWLLLIKKVFPSPMKRLATILVSLCPFPHPWEAAVKGGLLCYTTDRCSDGGGFDLFSFPCPDPFGDPQVEHEGSRLATAYPYHWPMCNLLFREEDLQ